MNFHYNRKHNLSCAVIFMVTPQILKFVDSSKTQKSKYLENNTFVQKKEKKEKMMNGGL